jgi:hypothetical protein
MEPHRSRRFFSFDLSDSTPNDIHRGVVLLVASDLATLAADAFGHVEVKPVLFPGLQGDLGLFGIARDGWSRGGVQPS